MEMFPLNFKPGRKPPLQSWLFGHRIQPEQTKYEYLIEFFQIAIASKEVSDNNANSEELLQTKFCDELFPVNEQICKGFSYYPKSRIGLKRFIFFPKSKLEGKANVDKEAYRACINALKDCMSADNNELREECVGILQNLLRGFSATNQNRSWFDQNMLPICPEVVLPEGMGVKKDRQWLGFQISDVAVDYKFDFKKYTYMCRGGEVYYLHLLNAINEYPAYKEILETRLNHMISSFPQFSYLCRFVQNTWENHMLYPEDDIKKQELNMLRKEPGAIPVDFSKRNKYTLDELTNFLNSKAHSFEKMEVFTNGIILQLLRLMYIVASTETDTNCWVIDVNCKELLNTEVKKIAITAFKHNEEIISNYLYYGYNLLKDELVEKDEKKVIKNAADDSYRLFRKLGKMIGLIIPNKGTGMRFTLSEDIIKFLVLAIIPPKGMITLDEFINNLYTHYGMVIGPEQYKQEFLKESLSSTSEISYLKENVKAFSQKLKDCGFLRDLSDATSIVENPYESEDT